MTEKHANAILLKENCDCLDFLGILLVFYFTDAYGAISTVCDSGHGCGYISITAALSTVGDGNNTITVNSPYTADDRVIVSQSGAGAGRELTIQAAPGYTPLTKGFHITANYVIVKGFECTKSGDRDGDMFVDGDYVKILNNIIHDNSSGSRSEMAVKPAFPSHRNITISGNHIYNTTPRGADYPLISFMGINSIISNNNIGPGVDTDGIRPWGHEVTISNNYFYDFILSKGSDAHMDLLQTFGDCGSPACHTAYNIYFTSNICTTIMHQLCNISNDYQPGIHDFYFRNNLVVNTGGQANIWIPNTHF